MRGGGGEGLKYLAHSTRGIVRFCRDVEFSGQMCYICVELDGGSVSFVVLFETRHVCVFFRADFDMFYVKYRQLVLPPVGILTRGGVAVVVSTGGLRGC